MASFIIRVILVELGAQLDRKEVVVFQNVLLSHFPFHIICCKIFLPYKMIHILLELLRYLFSGSDLFIIVFLSALVNYLISSEKVMKKWCIFVEGIHETIFKRINVIVCVHWDINPPLKNTPPPLFLANPPLNWQTVQPSSFLSGKQSNPPSFLSNSPLYTGFSWSPLKSNSSVNPQNIKVLHP